MKKPPLQGPVGRTTTSEATGACGAGSFLPPCFLPPSLILVSSVSLSLLSSETVREAVAVACQW